MTDEQITRALAEKVMGIAPATLGYYGESGGLWLMHPHGRWFKPLSVVSDAFAVLERMRSNFTIDLTMDGDRTDCRIANADSPKDTWGFTSNGDCCRAICIAALKAEGAWEE